MKHSVFFYIILIFLVITLNFFLPRFMPGSPVSSIMGEEAGVLSKQEQENILESYGLNKPIHEQFFDYIVNFFTLNWGTSFSKKQPITSLIGNALPWTLLLSVSNLLLATVFGCYLGFKSAFVKKQARDLRYMVSISFLSSLPLFWIGMALIAIFSVFLGWFPLYGGYSMWAGYTGFRAVLDVIWHLTLPLITLLTATISAFYIAMRYGILGVVSEDYVMMAKLRGLSSKRIKYIYVLRNSIIPVFTVFMIELGFVFGGSVIIESIFSYPGIGKLMYDAVRARDYPLVQYTFIIVSTMVIACNLIADIAYSKIDVRIGSHDE